MLKPKPFQMTDEVREMIQVRHSAEQRGHFEPLGRLLYLLTDHGRIEFPAEDGEFTGPDLGVLSTDGELIYDKPEPADMKAIAAITPGHRECTNIYVVLGRWSGLPSIRKLTNEPCPKCRHACDICEGSGTKQCEGFQCGGRGWIPGNWLPCSGPGCMRQTEAINPECKECRGSGQIAERRVCPMCEGNKVMTCPRCKGTKKFSTGKRNGAIDWNLPACKACGGMGRKGEMIPQSEKQFANAMLTHPHSMKGSTKDYLVLGPIREFAITHCHSTRTVVFDVSPDAAGDLLVLLSPCSRKQKPQKAYLVGGIVREREAREVSA